MRLFSFFLLFLISTLPLAASTNDLSLSYYFDNDIQFDPNIPTPDSILGYPVGKWHVRHDQLVGYLKLLAQSSNRIHIDTIGYTHEQRPLIMLTITSPERLLNIDQARKKHLARLTDSKITRSQQDPAVMWLGYSIHGNEASGSNAAMLVAYYLAAAQDEKVETLLNDTIILLDPSLNPDGLARFAGWANMYKGLTVSPDPAHKEHNQAWPNGRTNHYFFDLNRDWLLLQQPESQARIAQFHRWKPNVVNDFHEMGPNSTYFFQPGIPSRKHPLTPEENVTLTKAIAQFHAKALDKEQVLYFTEESYDDFYYGKGSTYPDINGSIGILFEQASSRGHQQQTINGLLTFEQTIKNQLTTSLSTFDAVASNRQSLLTYQDEFYNSAIDDAKNDKLNGYLISEEKDKSRLNDFLMLLKQHQINAYAISKDYQFENKTYSASHSYYIPLAQAQYRLIKAIFSEQKNFQDNSFYDVSGWTIAHAFNIEFIGLTGSWGLKYKDAQWKRPAKKIFPDLQSHYAYAFKWDDYLAPKMLNFLLSKGIKARVALDNLVASTIQGSVEFQPGSIVIPAGIQTSNSWLVDLQQIQSQFSIPVYSIVSGLTTQGIDLGSRKLGPVELPKVLLLGGKGTSQYEVGEVWHYLDQFVGIAPSLVDMSEVAKLDLSHYTHVILANGNFNTMTDGAKANIKQWVKRGGVIWGHKNGAKFLVDNHMLKTRYISNKEMKEGFETKGLTYADKDNLASEQRIAGAIFKTQVDLSHPLTFSIPRTQLPMFKNDTFLLEGSPMAFVNVAIYDDSPLMAGFTHENNIRQIKGSAALVAHNLGKGRVIGMTDNPVFRGYWYGTSRLLSNALFFAKAFNAKAE